MLTVAQKTKRREMAGSMPQTLEGHAASNFHFLWTGDEFCLFYECHHEIMSAGSWEAVDQLGRRRIITERRWSLRFSMVQGSAS
jgi:hypothetical protein